MYSILGLYRDNGKENGDYYIVYWGYSMRVLVEALNPLDWISLNPKSLNP